MESQFQFFLRFDRLLAVSIDGILELVGALGAREFIWAKRIQARSVHVGRCSRVLPNGTAAKPGIFLRPRRILIGKKWNAVRFIAPPHREEVRNEGFLRICNIGVRLLFARIGATDCFS